MSYYMFYRFRGVVKLKYRENVQQAITAAEKIVYLEQIYSNIAKKSREKKGEQYESKNNQRATSTRTARGRKYRRITIVFKITFR